MRGLGTLKRLALLCLAFIGCANPANAIIDRKVSCILGDESVLVTTEMSKTTLLQGAPIDLRIGHFGFENCLLSSITLEEGVQVDVCAVTDITATLPSNMDFFVQTQGTITWTHFHRDPDLYPVEITLDCLTDQGLE